VGFQYVNNSVRAELGGASVPVAVSQNGRTLTFQIQNTALPRAIVNSAVLNLVYAAQVTNDALRGNGINRATVSGIRLDNRPVGK
jgi:hypothetical protein